MNIVFLVVLIFLLLFFAYWVCRVFFDTRFLVKQFKSNNVLVFGAKGTGKDLIFSKVISKRKEPYLSNIFYGGNFEKVDLIDLQLGENSFDNFINGTVEKIKKVDGWEKKDLYFSDLGVYLPSHEDAVLTKKYKSLPILMALQRHLYNSNFHGNSQALIRTWKKFREQGDGYIRGKITFKIPFLPFLVTRAYYYDEYETAELRILPMKTRGLSNDMNRAMIEEHRARYGLVKELFIFSNLKKLKYDTRYFHQSVFGMSYEDWKNNQLRLKHSEKILKKDSQKIEKQLKEELKEKKRGGLL